MAIDRLTASDIDAATPPDRNRYADALRLLSILVVVYGHWLLAVVTVRDEQLEAVNLLTVEDWTHWLTWIFQVMPLFFFVGGYANAAAYRSARNRGVSWADWVRGRARRLLRPVLPLIVLWVPVGGALAWLGVDSELVGFASQVAIVPVWFLAAYLVVCVAVPVTYTLHERAPLRALAVLALLALLVDRLHLLGAPVIGWSNFLWIWGAIHQLGYLWHDGDRDAPAGQPRVGLPRSVGGALALAAAGYGSLLVLTLIAEYPVSMVGVDGAIRSNNTPPSIALLALAIGQIGLVLALRGPATRLLARPRVWAVVVMLGSLTMTVYLWHMTAMITVAAALIPTGLWPLRESIDVTWWATRPLWWLACTLALAGIVPVFGRFERAGAPRPRSSAIRAGAGAVLTTAGIGALVFGGLHLPGTATGVPWIPLGMLVLGLGWLGVLRRPGRAEHVPPPGGAAEPDEVAPMGPAAPQA
ncbi:MAG: acyltransferase family protein [Nitriliruptoraceae bacterium]